MFLVQNTPSDRSNPPEAFINEVAHRYKPRTEGSLKILNRLDTDSEIMCCRFNPQGNLLAVGLVNGVTKIYTVDPLSCVYVLPAEDTGGQPLPVTCLRWKPDTGNQDFKNILLATYASGSVKYWHVPTMSCISSVQEDGRQVLACAFNASASRYITAGSNTAINLYDSKTRQKLFTMEPSTSFLVMDGHMMRIFSVIYLPNDDNIFLSGGWDDILQWWDSRVDSRHSVRNNCTLLRDSVHAARRSFGPHICGDALDILPGNNNILTGSWRKDNSVQIWDFNSGELIRDVPDDFNKSLTYSAQWLSNGGIIAGGSQMNMLRMLEQGSTGTMTIGRVVDLPRAVYSVDNDRSGSNPKVALSTSNNIYIVQRS